MYYLDTDPKEMFTDVKKPVFWNGRPGREDYYVPLKLIEQAILSHVHKVDIDERAVNWLLSEVNEK